MTTAPLDGAVVIWGLLIKRSPQTAIEPAPVINEWTFLRFFTGLRFSNLINEWVSRLAENVHGIAKYGDGLSEYMHLIPPQNDQISARDMFIN